MSLPTSEQNKKVLLAKLKDRLHKIEEEDEEQFREDNSPSFEEDLLDKSRAIIEPFFECDSFQPTTFGSRTLVSTTEENFVKKNIKSSQDNLQIPVYIEKLSLTSSRESSPNPFLSREEDIPESFHISSRKPVQSETAKNDRLKVVELKHKKIEELISKDQKMLPTVLPNLKTYSGWLLKKKNGIISDSWKALYGQLANSKLLLYKNRTTGLFSAVIDFKSMLLLASYNEENSCIELKIKLPNFEKIFLLRAKEEETLPTWMTIIQYQISSNASVRKPLPSSRYFYKFPILSSTDLENVVETGDLLLFTGSRMGCKLQRLITGSRFDHVAMLLRCKENSILFIDATSNSGVSVCSWKTFNSKAYFKDYDRVVYRKLNFGRTFENQLKLETYLHKVKGKKYNLSPFRLFEKYSSTDSVNNISDSKGYFCSELIASIFKLMGFLPQEITSSHYWPGSFSAEKSLPLCPGVTLGEEQLISFF